MGDPGTGVSKGLNTRAGGVLVQCTYDGGNTRGMKWTRAACACRRFGLSGDGEAACMIADSNSKHSRPDHSLSTYTSTRKCENINFNLISLMTIGLSACYHMPCNFFFAACAQHKLQSPRLSLRVQHPLSLLSTKFPSVPAHRYACECTGSK